MRERVPTIAGLSSTVALLWGGEAALNLGTTLTQFALGIWVFQETGSAAQFSLLMIATMLPSLVSSPLAAAWADRFDRRWIIASVDTVLATMTVGLALLLFRDALQVWHLYVYNVAAAVLSTLRLPAYQALLCVLLPPGQLTRASGLLSFLQATVQLLAPLLAGLLMASSGLFGIIWVELGLLSSGMIAEFWALARSGAAERIVNDGRTLLAGVITGLSAAVAFLRRTPQLIELLIYMAIQDGLLVLVSAMLTPLILSTHTSRELGLVNSCAALGGLAGSLSVAVANMQAHTLIWVLVLETSLSVGVLVAGVYTSTAIWCVCAFGSLFAGSASGALLLAFWMRKTPAAQRGSVFALLNACHIAVGSLVMLVGGTLGERVFEPALRERGRWALTLGQWLGTGPGRGLGLLFVVCGVLCTSLSLFGLAHFHFSKLDQSVRDEPGLS